MSIGTTTTAPLKGTTFVATIVVSNVTDLNAASYHIVFDPAVLRLVALTAGAIGGTEVPITEHNEVLPGVVSVLQSLPGLDSAGGSGQLAGLVFQVIGSPGRSSSIGFEHLTDNRVLGDTQAQAIPVSSWDGIIISVADQ